MLSSLSNTPEARHPMQSNTAHRTLQQGEMLNWYRVERVLGRGGFGVIYLATDTNLQHHVAIKEYIPSEVATRQGDSHVHPLTEEHSPAFQWGMERFIKEARNLVRFNHPNIVRVMSVFEENNTAYMVMEFEEGNDLRAFLKQSGNNNEQFLKNLILPISKGLAEVHKHGFIHRDIKPANILVRKRSESPVLLDFGSARDASMYTQQNLTALVSVGYAPLEQYSSENDEQQGPWTDIYALGGTLYYAISGSDPVESTRRAAALFNGATDPLIAAQYLGEGRYSKPFLQAIDWAMQFRIADRPQTLEEWMPALLGTNEINPTHGMVSNAVQDRGGFDHSLAVSEQATSHTAATVFSHKQSNQYNSENYNPEKYNPENLSDASRVRPDIQEQKVVSSKPVSVLSGIRGLALLALLLSAGAIGIWLAALQTVKSQADNNTREVAVALNGTSATRPETTDNQPATNASDLSRVSDAAVSVNTDSSNQSNNEALTDLQGTEKNGATHQDSELPGASLQSGGDTRSNVVRDTGAGNNSDQDNVSQDNGALVENNTQAVALVSDPVSSPVSKLEQTDSQNNLTETIEAAQAADRAAEKARVKAAAEAARLEQQKEPERRRIAEDQRKARETALQIARAREEARLRQAIAAAQSSMAVGDLDAARQQWSVADSIKSSDPRVETLGFAIAAAQEEYDKPVSDADFETVTRMFDGLRRAIEAGDTVSMDRLALESEQSTLFKALLQRFESIEINIKGIRVRNAEKAITGLLEISAMKRSNGDRAIPSDAYRSREIRSKRVRGGWSKIQW